MCTENCSRESNRRSSYTNVAKPSIFLSSDESSYRLSSSSEGNSQKSYSSKARLSTSTKSQPNTDGMQIIRQSLFECRISSEIADVIMFSWRGSTKKQYNVYINQWIQFCSERTCDPLHPTVNNVLFYLHSLYEKGLSYSALNTARSAISNIDSNYIQPNHTSIGKHPLVCRYLKGIFNKQKPVPKFNTIWSVDLVLDYLSLLWPLVKITLKELTLKLVMLIALTTGQRCQTQTYLDISNPYMKKNESCIEFALTEHLKQDRPGKVFGNVRLYKYPIKERCVYETLEFYLKATEDSRNSTRLLVAFIKPYQAATSSTIGRWLKTVLAAAGIDTNVYSAYSTRCASTSKAVVAISADMIIRTA
eukprot:Seg317.5 transcript_id=Seg317.5/GoldUCD/mRNA.D3Y31 product="hypothetical protein" protein_id=Seg317.5/GoldUCD/D3Y31